MQHNNDFRLTEESTEKLHKYLQANPGCSPKIAVMELAQQGVTGLNKGMIYYHKKKLGLVAKRKYNRKPQPSYIPEPPTLDEVEETNLVLAKKLLGKIAKEAIEALEKL